MIEMNQSFGKEASTNYLNQVQVISFIDAVVVALTMWNPLLYFTGFFDCLYCLSNFSFILLVLSIISWLSDLSIWAFQQICPFLSALLTKIWWTFMILCFTQLNYTFFLLLQPVCPLLASGTAVKHMTPEDFRYTCEVSRGLTPQVCLSFSHWVTAQIELC